MKEPCCEDNQKNPEQDPENTNEIKKKQIDYFLSITLLIILVAYIGYLVLPANILNLKYINTFTSSTFELMNRMSWGLALGIIFVGILNRIPREIIQKIMGKSGTISGILRATAGGVLLDLCSHGILLVGMKLYKQGLGLGQTMAFLIASPWNSLSLTLVLWALIGFKWMISFLLLSMLMAIISGIIFDKLVKKKILPSNPNKVKLPPNYSIKKDFKNLLKNNKFTAKTPIKIVADGVKGSKMILRWIFFGVILASAIRTFISPEQFQTLFGPTVLGLISTIFIATIIEVCSEGSTPIAADILTRAGAPGNSFAFLMVGVSTDYTEILGLKETTGSWKIALFLPLITLPQVIIIALLL
jgi:hypothetical protein